MTLKLIPAVRAPRPARPHDAYAALRFRAVVDWVELKVVTAAPSNFDTLRKRTGASFVQALDESAGGAATEFLVRMQEPSHWQDVEDALGRFTADHALAKPVTIHAIEIALDAYSRINRRDDLVAMTLKFYKFAKFMASEKRRMSRGKGDTHDIVNARWLTPKDIADGYNVYVGNKGEPVQQHIYLKETTHQDGVAIALPSHEHRARTEVTFTGNGVPDGLVSNWRSFEIAALSGYFSYRRPKDELDPLLQLVVQTMPQVGEAKPRRAKSRHRRMHSTTTCADIELNARAYSALRELTKRMQGGAKATGPLAA